MTIAHVNTAAKATSTLGTIDVPYCSPVTSGNVLLLAIYNKYATGSAPSTPADWTQIAQRPGGIGAPGNDAGTGILTIYRKESTGAESGNVTVSITGTANMIMGFMIQYSKASGSSWGFASASGVDASAGTAWSVTGDSDPGLLAGDMLLTFSGVNGNLSLAFVSGSVSQSGVTFGSHTERFDDNTTAGSDAAMTEYEHPVSSGTSSGNPTFTMTGDGSGASSPTGPTIFVRLREISASTYNDAFSINRQLSLLNVAGLNIQDTFSLGKQLSFPEIVITLYSITGGYAFGEQNPTQGETAVSWQTWSNGSGGTPTISGDTNWGKLMLDESGQEARSAVYDLGSTGTRTFTLFENRYGTGNTTPVLYIRGDTSIFLQDDILPAWEVYSSPVSRVWRYVQVRESTIA